jgi:hypothetical protein
MDNRQNVWDMIMLMLWILFFAAGLLPEITFLMLRDLAAVAPHSAIINSSSVITITFSAYIAFFALRRARQAGLAERAARGKAMQVGMLALVAFIEIPTVGSAFETRTVLGLLVAISQFSMPEQYYTVLFVGVSKIVCWVYLFSLVFRYHAVGIRDVFARIPNVFPSARHIQSTSIPQAPPRDSRAETASRAKLPPLHQDE